MFHFSAPVKVYENDSWWSDKWDALDYGQDYDATRPFLLQLKELVSKVPWLSRSVLNLSGSDYCSNAADLKNCYLVFNATSNENCSYCVGLERSKDSSDNTYLYDSELCYGCFYCLKCHKAMYSTNCESCGEIYFSDDCKNCFNCLGCVGLRNKNYHIFNRLYSKDEYFAKLKEFSLGSHKSIAEIRKKVSDLRMRLPLKYTHGERNVNCSGDFINNSKNVINSYFIKEGEDLKHCMNVATLPGAKDSYDYSFWGNNARLIYECCQVGINVANLKFSVFIFSNCQNVEYSVNCNNSSNIFGCVGLRKKQYCILNKQYGREEYESLKSRIIADMDANPYIDAKGRVWKYGEFFPFDFSPVAYNDSFAQEVAPMTKEKTIEIGAIWRDPDEKTHQYTVKWSDLPDHIDEVDESILKEVILCQDWENDEKSALEHNCSGAFRITTNELAFYRRMNIPLPKKCFNSRHFERTKQQNPLKLWHRKCQCNGAQSENKIYQNTISHFHNNQPCPNEFETAYSPDRPEIVYCEKCYQSEVV